MAMFAKVVPDVVLMDVRLIRDEKNVKKGFAFVDVESSEMAEKSLKLNNYHLKGKALKIHIYKPPSEG
jgi:RNA recognition motif-containing protein